MNRIDRVTAILIQLQTKRVVKAQEVAERFNISLRTVYRDIKTLDEAGIPIVGEAGVGYSIMEGYRLPPVMFTREEAMAFLVAEKMMEKYTDKDNSEKYSSAMYKIKAVLKTAEKDFLEEMDSSIQVFKPMLASGKETEVPIQKILNTIIERKIIHINYLNAYAQSPTQRWIEPIGTYHQHNQWYLIAYCRLKNDYRNFRMDRLVDIKFSDEKYTRQHISLSAYIEKVSHEGQLQTIVIQVEKETAKYIATQKYYYGFVSETDLGTHTEMVFLSASLEGFARWYLMIAPNAKIIKPADIQIRVKSLVQEILQNL